MLLDRITHFEGRHHSAKGPQGAKPKGAQGQLVPALGEPIAEGPRLPDAALLLVQVPGLKAKARILQVLYFAHMAAGQNQWYHFGW